MKKLLLLVGALLVGGAVQADEATVTRDTTIYAEPSTGSASLKKVKKGASLTVGERQRGWYPVSVSDSQQGWVRMTTVRLKTLTDESESGVEEALKFATTGRSSSSGVTAGTGVRGLDVEDVENAEPDQAGVDSLDAFAVDKKQAKQFAKQGELKKRKVKSLPDEEADKEKAEQEDEERGNSFGLPGFGG